jgi:hypothetical protein
MTKINTDSMPVPNHRSVSAPSSAAPRGIDILNLATNPPVEYHESLLAAAKIRGTNHFATQSDASG